MTAIAPRKHAGAVRASVPVTRSEWRRAGLIAGPVIAGIVAMAARPVTDSDAWWNVRAGEVLRQTWVFSGPDPLSTFSSREFIRSSWAGDLVASLVHDAMGSAGLVLMRAVAIIVLAIFFLVSARREADDIPAVIAAFVGLIGCVTVGETPLSAGVIFTMVAVMAWRRSAVTLRPPWWLIGISWIWASTHPSWVLGPVIGLVTVLGLGRDRQLSRPELLRFTAVIGASVVAAALTPVGPRLISSVFDAVPSSGAALAGWSFTTMSNPGALVVGGSVLLLLVGLLRTGVRPPWWQVGHGVLALVLCLTLNRLVPFAACLVVPLVAEGLQALRGRAPTGARTGERRAFLVGIATAVGICVCLVQPLGHVSRDPASAFSARLESLPAGTVLFDSYDTASWLLLAEPHLELVFDTRVQLYDPAYIAGYTVALTAKPGWSDFVDASGATTALLPEASPLATALQERRGWHATQSTKGYVLLVRD